MIRHFRLRRDFEFRKLEVFQNEDMCLVVGGIGKVAAALSMTCLLSRHAFSPLPRAVNIGIAGCTDPAVPVGRLFLIHAVTDAASGRSFHPDLLVQHGLPECRLLTVDRPVDGSQDLGRKYLLVDMEAAGFLQAALTFLPPHRVACLKLVSDHLEGNRISKSAVEDLVAGNIPVIESVLQAYSALPASEAVLLSPEEEILVKTLKTNLRLSTAQIHQLTGWCFSCRRRGGAVIPRLTPFTALNSNHKQDRNRFLEQIRQTLLAD